MDSGELSNQDQDGLADDVNASLGENEGEQTASAEGGAHQSQSNDPLYVQKRLKQQKRSHEREMREMQSRMDAMQSRLSNMPSNDQMTNPQTMQPMNGGGGLDEQIHKAVSYALNAKDDVERKAREAESNAHVQKNYRELKRHLENMSDKYDDFHDTVFGDDAHFTPAMRDYAMTLPKNGAGSAGEVLYKLGQNPEELNRISKLHPLNQASEMMKLSHALIKGGEDKTSSTRPLGQIKNNPVSNSHAVTEKTPVSSLRARMKAGSWK
jgi:hypothetical protein